MTCLTCTHWDAQRTPPEIRKVGLCACAHGPRWEYLPPEQACKRFEAVPADVAAKRVAWHAKRFPDAAV